MAQAPDRCASWLVFYGRERCQWESLRRRRRTGRCKSGVSREPVRREVINGLIEGFADNIPTGNLDSAEHSDQGSVGVLRVPAGVNYPPEFFNLEWIPSYDVSFYNVLNELGNFAGLERHAVHLSETLNIVIGGQF